MLRHLKLAVFISRQGMQTQELRNQSYKDLSLNLCRDLRPFFSVSNFHALTENLQAELAVVSSTCVHRDGADHRVPSAGRHMEQLINKNRLELSGFYSIWFEVLFEKCKTSCSDVS